MVIGPVGLDALLDSVRSALLSDLFIRVSNSIWFSPDL